MRTRKNKKSNKRFRRTRSKRQRGGAPKSIKRTREDDNMALIQASIRGDTETVAMLLEKGADVNAKNNDGRTALILASENGRTEIVAMLLEKGADVSAKGDYGYTALIWASLMGRTDIVEMLLEKGADVNAKNNGGRTALHWASHGGPTEIVAKLLDAGADMNAKTTWGMTALMKASDYENTEIVKLLIIKGATIPDDREDLKEIKKNIERKKDHENLDIIQAAARRNKTTMPASGKRIFSWDPGQGPGAAKFKEYLGGKRKTRKSKK